MFINFKNLKFVFSKPFLFRKSFFFSEKKAPLFLEKSKFNPSEPGFIVYKSREKPLFILFTIGFLGSFGYFSFRSYWEFHNLQDGYLNMYMSVFLICGFAILQWKINKTLKNMYLDIDGKSALIETFSYGGLKSSGLKIDNKLFKGFGLFCPKILKSLQMPIMQYQWEAKREFFFFKTEFVLELDILMNMLQGKEYLVSDDLALNYSLSKKQKKRF